MALKPSVGHKAGGEGIRRGMGRTSHIAYARPSAKTPAPYSAATSKAHGEGQMVRNTRYRSRMSAIKTVPRAGSSRRETTFSCPIRPRSSRRVTNFEPLLASRFFCGLTGGASAASVSESRQTRLLGSVADSTPNAGATALLRDADGLHSTPSSFTPRRRRCLLLWAVISRGEP